MRNKKYYSLEKKGAVATLNIFDDISLQGYNSKTLSQELKALEDINQINVHINSYGGEVAEGLAIYNTLKNHKAKVTTFCDGFACSIASIIFLSGDERVMNESSLLMIHNTWTFVQGNAIDLRKEADDLDKITNASIKIYRANSNLNEEEIKALLDKETWISSEEALEMGFATSILKNEKSKNASQSIRSKIFNLIKQATEEVEVDDEVDVNDVTSDEDEILIDDDTLNEDDTNEIKIDFDDDTEDGTSEEDLIDEEEKEDDEEDSSNEQKTLFEKFLNLI